MSDKQDVIDWVIKSIETEPEKWSDLTSLGYNFTHENGVSVWIGSMGPCTTAIEYGASRIGGLTFLSMFADWGFPNWRTRVHKAARTLRTKPYRNPYGRNGASSIKEAIEA